LNAEWRPASCARNGDGGIVKGRAWLREVGGELIRKRFRTVSGELALHYVGVKPVWFDAP
jgi:hypothetical protein